MDNCVGPHQNELAKRAKGRINAHVDFGLGCAYGPNFSFRGENWNLHIFRYDEGWFVHFPFGQADQLYYDKLIDLFDDMMDLGAMNDRLFATNDLLTFCLIAQWDDRFLPDPPDEILELAEKPTRGAIGAVGSRQ
jgi:hypothetical protein